MNGHRRSAPAGPRHEMTDASPHRLGTRIRIDPSSRIPPFEQLRAQLALMVSSGRLRPGSRLPTVRGLAETLQLSNGTVARAYRELEAAGIVAGRGRRGTFVADAPPNTYSAQERRRVLADAAATFVAAVRQLDIGDSEALDAISEALDQPTVGPAASES